MRVTRIAVCCLALFPAARAQNTGALAGEVTGPTGAALTGAPIRVTHEAGRQEFRVLSSDAGAYQLSGLPPGDYTVSVIMPGFSYLPYRREGVMVGAGQTLRLDIRIEEGRNQSTLGDDPEVELARLRDARLSGPVPRTADGRPDLSGVWFGQHDLYPETPDALPWAEELSRQRLEDNLKDNPGVHCLPREAPLAGPFMWKFVQMPELLMILNEHDVISHREVFLDGRAHPAEWNPSWNGHSTGRWEGDTLVVDRTGFNDRGWITTYPRTETLHIVERFRRTDYGHLDVLVTIEDPGVFRKQWNIHMTWTLVPGMELFEYVCTENNSVEHLVGK
jgi:hypothetical protein